MLQSFLTQNQVAISPEDKGSSELRKQIDLTKMPGINDFQTFFVRIKKDAHS